MKRAVTVLVLTLAAGLVAPATLPAQTAERLSDKDVKALLEEVDHRRDRFEDALDGGFKNAIVRGPRGEASVNKYLDDFQREVGQAKDRFKPEYAASTEVRAVLSRGSEIDAFIKGQPASFKGASEWDRLLVELRRLAGIYGASFPLPQDAAVRRINDRETAATAEQLAAQADLLKKAVGNDKALTSAERNSLKRSASDLAKAAKTVKSRTSSGQPATGEVRQVFDLVSSIEGSPAAQKYSPATLSSLGVMRANLSKLEQAFNLGGPAVAR
jgi:hypothetical protein